MIVPMNKITLVVLEKERSSALEALRKTGVLHVQKREAVSQQITDLLSRIAKVDQVSGILSEIPVDAKALQNKPLNFDESAELVERVLKLRDERRQAQDTVTHLNRELERTAVWGDIKPADFEYLAEKGLQLFAFEMSVQDYTSLPAMVNSIVVNRDKKNIRCVLWGESDLLPADMPQGARELTLPEESTALMREKIAQAESALKQIDSLLKADALRITSLDSYKEVLRSELEYESIHAGMPVIEMGRESENRSAYALVWLTGYVPVDQSALIAAAAKEHGWAVIVSDPAEEDAVPTKIRNNRFVNLISPLLEFLGTVPGYRELDISLWFLLFFGIFFAMIFGDAGYGALLTVASLAAIVSAKIKGKSAPTGLYMFVYLGLMTVVWGAVTCTWFGIPVAGLPTFLLNLAIPSFSNANPDTEGVKNTIKVFCFTLGLIQISLAHVIGMVRNIRSLKLLGELGALLMTIGMFFVVLNLVVDAQKYPLTSVILGMIGGGFALNFLFINYAGSILGGFMESLKNVITMCLGVVNMFGDIMSYIRLWAVGLAGAAISTTVNEMAGPMLGGFIIFAGIILLFFGHGLNLVMNVLSVIVHGVRLNTLEFSNHLGLTWSGFKYEPFSETVKK